MKLEQRNFRADPLKLTRLRISANLTVAGFAKSARLTKDTARKILRGDPVFLHTLASAVHDAFGIEDPLEVLHPDELAVLGIVTELPSPNQILEWEITEYLSGWEKTTNGLQYQLVKLRHRFLNDRFACGKCYELRHLSTSERIRLETYLVRHAKVCERIGEHPNISRNLTAALVDGLWWVLDRWEEGELLADRLASGSMSGYELQYITTGIANGLLACHESNVIRRELSPRSIILRESSDAPVLTDMELAKLSTGAPTVSPEEWPDDPYRALEVCGNTPYDERADIYSWGRIFVHCANGILPERGCETLPDTEEIPIAVREIVLQSVALSPSKRPSDIRKILDVLRGWI